MLTIQQLSHEVNIGVDTLRIWERRYGFPKPLRDGRGHRRYPTEQLEALRTVRALQNLGYRPNKIFALSDQERKEVIAQQRNDSNSELSHYEQLILEGSFEDIQDRLTADFNKAIEPFIFDRLIPLVRMMGRFWEEGVLSISREHLISDVLTDLLRGFLSKPQPVKKDVRIAFVTLCGERHKLALLMSAVLFHQRGVDCVVINEELPLTEVPRVIEDTSCQAVALSFSRHYPARQARKDLATLRNLTPPDVQIIAGGQAVSQPFHLPGLHLCSDLTQVSKLADKLF